MLAESHEEGLIEEIAHELLTGVLDFGERPVRTVMVPRDDIMLGHPAHDRAEAEELVVASGHSRLLVAGRDLDDVVGFVHAKDLLTSPAEAARPAVPLRAASGACSSCPSTQPSRTCCVAMRRSRIARRPRGRRRAAVPSGW